MLGALGGRLPTTRDDELTARNTLLTRYLANGLGQREAVAATNQALGRALGVASDPLTRLHSAASSDWAELEVAQLTYMELVGFGLPGLESLSIVRGLGAGGRGARSWAEEILEIRRVGGAGGRILPTRTSWFLPKTGGGAWIGGRWYTEHALERMAPRTPQVMAELESRALARARAAGLERGTPEFGKWWGKHGPNPRNVPPSVIEAEIAVPGSTGVRVITNAQGDVVTVIPGGF